MESSNVIIFSLSETWLTEAVPNNCITMKDYQLTRLDRSWSDKEGTRDPKRGGGLACYIKDGINFSDSKYANLNMSTKDLEMMWLSISMKNVRPIVVVTI